MHASIPKVAILQTLLEGPSYARKIVRDVGDRTGGEITLWYGSVNQGMRRLEADGLIVECDTPEGLGEDSIRPVRCVKLTAKGKRQAQKDRRAAGVLFGLVEPTE